MESAINLRDGLQLLSNPVESASSAMTSSIIMTSPSLLFNKARCLQILKSKVKFINLPETHRILIFNFKDASIK